MHKLGFEILETKKGIFVDGHEWDVVENQKKFLRQMVMFGFLNAANAPTDKAKSVHPDDLECIPHQQS